jgi:phosphoglycolate phosphatase
LRDLGAVLFDKDGTLLDFSATWTHVFTHAASVFATRYADPELASQLLRVGGLDPDTGAYTADSVLACGATPEIAKLWAHSLNVAVSEGLVAQLDGWLNALSMRRIAPVVGLNRALGALHEAGFVLGVATMDTVEMAHSDLCMLGVQDYFSFVCGADSGFGYKPGPGMVNAFCDASGLTAERVVMVGDTTHDLNMGRNAGVGLTVGVLTGASDRAALASLADEVIAGAGDLPALLGI